MSVDAKARYAQSHEYARQEGDLVVVGISDHAQDELGDIVFVELKEAGKKLEKGQVFGTIESVKAASDVYAPIGGHVSEINQELERRPELVNTSPYNDGWFFKIAEGNLREFDTLMSSTEYTRFVEDLDE